MKNDKGNSHIGVGPNQELRTRVSVATLTRVLFKDPEDDQTLLALERKASVKKIFGGSIVQVISQPFGGAIRIKDLNEICNLLNDFHFDSERSRSQNDFRLFIRPEDWPMLREFTIEHLGKNDDPVIETDPARELAEEFNDALQVPLEKRQYQSIPAGLVLEDQPMIVINKPTEVLPSVRIYRIFEVNITDLALGEMLEENTKIVTNQELVKLALEDARDGGKGRANAVFISPLEKIIDFYHTLPVEERKSPALYKNNRLSGNIPAILDDVYSPLYQRLLG